MRIILESPNMFEIWDAKVEFEDQPNKIKSRPVLIDSDGDVFIIAYKITSKSPRSNYDGEYSIRLWKEAGLNKPSTIRLNKILNIRKENLIKLRGHLQRPDIKQVINLIKKLK